MRNHRFLNVFLVFIALLAGCQILPPQLQDAIDRELADLDPNVLFQDDFSSTKSNWITKEDDSGSRNYQNDEYRFYIAAPETNAWSYPRGLSFDDVRIDVFATRVGGDADNIFGILCRYQDEGNYYQLLVSSDGYYDISKVKDGGRIPLIGEQLLPTEAISLDEKTILLGAECIDENLALFVNGVQIAKASDVEFDLGNVGLLAGSFRNPGVEIHFDDFVVWRP